MPVAAGPNINKSGLILSLDATDITSYPGSGTTWYDLSGGNYHSTLYNGITYTTINGVKALTLDGIDEWIGNTTLPGSWSDFTLELVFYHNGLDQAASYGIISMGTNGNYGPMFYCHNSCLGSHYYPGSPSGDYPGGQTNWQNNSWNLYTWVYSNTTIDNNTGNFKNYVNGAYSSGTANYNFQNGGMGRGSNGFALGCYSGGSAVYKGSFTLFRVYNRALDASEINQNYQQYKTRFNLN